MKKTNRLISLVMAIALMAGTMMPVMAEEAGEAGLEASFRMPTSIEIHGDRYKSNVHLFEYKDGVYYYDANLIKKNISDAKGIYNELIKTLSCFKGYDGEAMGRGSPSVISQWADVGIAAMENSGIDHKDVEPSKGYGIIYAEGLSGESLRDLENKAVECINGHPVLKVEKKALENETKRQHSIGAIYNYEPIDGPEKRRSVLGVYLYNFRVTPVLNDDYIGWARDHDKAVFTNNIKEDQKTSTGAVNHTPIEVRNDQWVQIQKAQSHTKEDNGSFSHSYTESTKVSVEAGFDDWLKITSELGFTATQAFSSGWSESNSTTYSEAKNTTQSVTLPGYTGVTMKQSNTDGTYKIGMDTPLALSYDVKLVYYGNDKTGTSVPKVLATYEGNRYRGSTDAQSDLFQRVYNGKENQGLRYLTDKAGKNQYAYNAEDTVNRVARFVPYFTAEETESNGSIKDTIMETCGFIPLHPLKSVDTVKNSHETEIKKGSQIYLRDIELAGYLNKQYSDGKGGTAKYATFNARQGHWEIVSGGDRVKIETDSQKNQILTGLKEGTAEIKYVIDEDCYNSAEDHMKFAKNSELESTASYRIKVNSSRKASATLYDLKALTQTAEPMAEAATPWSETAKDGVILGSTEEGAPAINAIQINSQNPDLVDIACTTEMTSGQEMMTTASGEVAGDENRQEAIEAFALHNLKGEDDQSDICYRAYVQGEGWTNWARNGELAGSHGYGKAITAVQTALVGNYESAPADGSEAQDAYLVAPGYGQVNYSADGTAAKDGEVLGDPDSDALLGDVTVSTDPAKADLEVTLEKEGIEKTEAVAMNLAGHKADAYDLYYRVNSENTGWMSWAKNGEKAGSKDLGRGIKAIQIILVKKGETLDQNKYSYDTVAAYEEKQPDDAQAPADMFSDK
ncbi:hypothetical protein [Eubacterium sp. 1001713B170207_170306_E7]|uniref:hypothetical protein n=1 Tax=Eubacterium sp. 1001713B170207_170306_E7 TaxID=2787097 RepID=UPI00189AD2B8|nr:hypothetical protein [Eubacterium sp. 1001713B170207_170306_E7]